MSLLFQLAGSWLLLISEQALFAHDVKCMYISTFIYILPHCISGVRHHWKCDITLVFSTLQILVDMNTGFVPTSVLPMNVMKDLLVVGEICRYSNSSRFLVDFDHHWDCSCCEQIYTKPRLWSLTSWDSKLDEAVVPHACLAEAPANPVPHSCLSTAPSQSCSWHWAANKSRTPFWLKEGWKGKGLILQLH